MPTPDRKPRPRFTPLEPSNTEAATLCRDEDLVTVEIRLEAWVATWIERAAAEDGANPSAVVNGWCRRRILAIDPD